MKDFSSLITNKDEKPLRILQIGKHTCIRVIRISESLKKLGYNVNLLTNKISYGTELFDEIAYYHNKKQFQNYIQSTLGKYDIYECHNEPDDMIVWAKEVLGKAENCKLVHNAHDIDSIRRNIIPIPERHAFNFADAIVYVSKPIQKICNDLHKVTVPSMVLYNYATRSMIDSVKPELDITKHAGLVYEGGVNPIDNSEESVQLNEVFPYRNLFPIFQKLIALGNEVHVYAGNSSAFNTGQHTGCILYPPLPFNQLLQALTKYKYNLLVFNNENGTENQVNYTTPNKLWDAVGAGIPSIACYCQETMNYIDKHGLGWSFQHLKEIGNCSQLEQEYKQKMDNVIKKRQELVFENQIWMEENMYATILGVEKKGIPDNLKQLAEFEYGAKAVQKLLLE